MISLNRNKNNRSVLQKNVSSKEIIKAYLDVISNTSSAVNYEDLKNELKTRNIYKGRSAIGSISTMGVRFSQMCFYMFGYKVNRIFVPSPMTENLLRKETDVPKESSMLVNLFSMQFPHPYSKGTASSFNLYFGRLLVKLLLESRINKRMYIDELIWFLPFLDKIDKSSYEELVKSINEYRNLSFEEKVELFHSIPEYEEFMATTMHEFKYYFLRIFEGFGVFNLVQDPSHNGGNLIKFTHPGTSGTDRSDIIDGPKGDCSGYFELSPNIIEDAIKLTTSFSAFDKPTTMCTPGINSLRDWLTALYDTEPLEYLSAISKAADREREINDTIQKMVYASKYGSHDGKDFENSLEPFIYLFRETANVEIIAGAGNTDLLCAMEDSEKVIYKMNVDAKTRRTGLSEVNGRHLEKHLRKHGSKFCIVVSPRFASGVADDIYGYRIVTIRAEDFGSYCYKECKNSSDGYADFESIHQIIEENLGTDITNKIRQLTENRYGISI